MPTHALTHYDPSTRVWTVTFFPCRHRITFTDCDISLIEPTDRERRAFAKQQQICWACHFALEAPDA